MNWTKIEKDYPKAFKAYAEHNGVKPELINAYELDMKSKEGSDAYYFNMFSKDRDLYDFFDEQGIVIALVPFSKSLFQFDILLFDKTVISECQYDNRPEAETAAFKKAFEILESKLK